MPSHKGISCQCVTEVGFLEVQCWLSGDRPKPCLLLFSGSEGFLFLFLVSGPSYTALENHPVLKEWNYILFLRARWHTSRKKRTQPEVFLSLENTFAMGLDRPRHGEICPRFSELESCLAASGEMSSLGLENSAPLRNHVALLISASCSEL